jgi:hypothetical protein
MTDDNNAFGDRATSQDHALEIGKAVSGEMC